MAHILGAGGGSSSDAAWALMETAAKKNADRKKEAGLQLAGIAGAGQAGAGSQSTESYAPGQAVSAAAAGNTDALAYLQQRAQAQQRAREAVLQAGLDNYTRQASSLAQEREQGARSAYIRRRQAYRDLPGRLAQSGITGGLAESAALALEARYSREMAALEAEYRTARQKLEGSLADLRLADAKQKAEDEADYYKAASAAAAKTTTAAKTATTAGKSTTVSSGESAAQNSTSAQGKAPAYNLSPESQSAAPAEDTQEAQRSRATDKAARRRALERLGLTPQEVVAVLYAEGY